MLLPKPQELWAFREKLSRLLNDAFLLYFTAETHCRHCRQEKVLLANLTEMHSRIHLELYNLDQNRKIADQYGVDKVPGLVVAGEKDFGVKFYGMPSEIEMHALIDDIVMVSFGESGLSPESEKKLRGLDQPVHLEVFTSPTCMFSRGAIRFTHQMSVASDHVTGDVVDIVEFPNMVEKYDLRASPTIMVNRNYRFYEPITNEKKFLDEVFKGLSGAH